MSCSPPSPQTRLCVSAQSPSFPKPPLVRVVSEQGQLPGGNVVHAETCALPPAPQPAPGVS